jgi:hypothetical protein
MKDHWLQIIDLDSLIDFTRKLIYHNFDEKNKHLNGEDFINQITKMDNGDDDDLENILPFNETKLIVQECLVKKRNKRTKQIGFFIKESTYQEILNKFHERMVSNIVRSLVDKGLLEMAFDEEKNDFVFWVSQDK